MLVAMIFDFLDGFAARALKVTSSIGKELDSLADMVTFGVVPGAIAYKLIEIAVQSHFAYPFPQWAQLLPYGGFFLTVFSALRLARFNVDERQSDQFIGLPTPANAMFWISIPISTNYQGFEIPELLLEMSLNPYVLIAIVITMGLLLVAPLPLIALKFKHYRWRENQPRYALLLTSGVLLITFGFMSVPIIILLYLVISVINNLTKKKNEVQS